LEDAPAGETGGKSEGQSARNIKKRAQLETICAENYSKNE
jgi:hypothetical protein